MLPRSQPNRQTPEIGAVDVSSPSQASIVSRNQAKRLRSRTPSGEEIPLSQTLLQTPATKKARLEAEADMPLPLPPPTLSKSSLPRKSRSPTPLASSGLDMKGLHVPITPKRQVLPTLTELLSTSRRSNPRLHPPSRKAMSDIGSLTRAKEKGKGKEVPGLELPLTPIREAPSSAPTKMYFPSPATGPSGGSTHRRPQLPVSPLVAQQFTQQPAVFAPQFASTQPQTVDRPVQGLLDAGPRLVSFADSEFFEMGYSSQFDVEGNVNRVTELLERDVDFGAWIRDAPETEDESRGQ